MNAKDLSVKNILVVDNDRIILRFMTKLLEKEGHQVMTAGDGLKALDILNSFKPDVIFVDLVMPNIDGEMLCKILRDKKAFKNTYIVILSAIAAEEAIDIAKIGADACIAKGSFKEMTQHIHHILKEPELAAKQCRAGEVFGIKSIYPRGITGELLTSKKHFQIILEKMSEGVVEINSDGRIIFANASALGLVNKPEEKLIGTFFIDLFAGESQKRVKKLLEENKKGKKPRLKEPPFSLNTYQVTLQVLSFAEEGFSGIIMSDVTDWVKTNQSLEKRKREIELLHQAGQDLNSSLELDRVLANVLEEVRRLIDVSGSLIWILNADTGELVCKQAAGVNSRILKNWCLSAGEGLPGWVAAHGESLTVADTRKDDRHFKDVDLKTGIEMRSVLSVPFKVKDRVIGVLQLVDSEAGRFDNTHQNLLELLAASAAIAIENAGLYEQAQKEIADRKQAETALRESERKYKDIFENVSDLLYFHDLKGNFVETNLAFLRDYGYTAVDMINLNIKDLVPAKYRKKVPDYLKRVKENGKDEGLMVVQTKGDKELIVEYRNSIIYDNGKPVGVRGSARDITKRIRTEQALRESEEKYRTILESIEEGYFEVDLKGNFTFFNNALRKILGYPEEELLGMNNRENTSSETAEKLNQLFNQIYESSETRRLDAYEVIRKDGEKVTLELSAALIRDSRENPVGFRGVVRDITERLRSDKERRRLEEQLRQSQRLEAIGTLAGGIAHDFNNLLMGIQGNVSLILYSLEPDDTDREKLENIEQYVQNGAALTRQLLGFARSGRYEIKPADLNELVKNSSTMFGRTKKEIDIHTTYQEEVWPVEIDKGQIEQVLLNVYVNAWQAMPGGGELFVETKNLHLDKNSVKTDMTPGDYVAVSVRDTGVGMDTVVQQKIFDPFFTTKEMGRGTGLGLASAYGIIKSHGGFIEVQSKKGKGSTFSFFLPRSRGKVDEERVPTDEIIKGKESILLVDDEELILDVSRQILEKLGYRVTLASSGRQAIAAYEKMPDRIDMVILDMIMPGLSGGETYDRIKEINPRVKVMLSSGYSMDGEATEILKRGCHGFIQKPFDMKKLSRKIREILEES